MGKSDPVLMMMREICLSLPDTQETMTWGQPHFRVGDKIFSGCGQEKGKQVIGFKLEMEHADEVIRDPRFWRAPYVGHKGWVSMDAGEIKDWGEVRPMILESYRLIAPKKTLVKLGGSASAAGRRGAHNQPRTRRLGAKKVKGGKSH